MAEIIKKELNSWKRVVRAEHPSMSEAEVEKVAMDYLLVFNGMEDY